ncbi:MAG: flagellar basal body-associated protein FliL [Clostridiaceae bacterium]
MAGKDKEKKGGGSSKIIIILLALILIAGIGFGAYYVLVLSKNTVHVEEHPYKDMVTFSLGDPFTVNLADKEVFILKTKINVVYKTNSKLTEELTTKKAILRDRVIAVIRTKTENELTTDKNLEKFKAQIIEAINPVLEEGQVEEVVTEEFITGK